MVLRECHRLKATHLSTPQKPFVLRAQVETVVERNRNFCLPLLQLSWLGCASPHIRLTAKSSAASILHGLVQFSLTSGRRITLTTVCLPSFCS